MCEAMPLTLSSYYISHIVITQAHSEKMSVWMKWDTSKLSSKHIIQVIKQI